MIFLSHMNWIPARIVINFEKGIPVVTQPRWNPVLLIIVTLPGIYTYIESIIIFR